MGTFLKSYKGTFSKSRDISKNAIAINQQLCYYAHVLRVFRR